MEETTQTLQRWGSFSAVLHVSDVRISFVFAQCVITFVCVRDEWVVSMRPCWVELFTWTETNQNGRGSGTTLSGWKIEVMFERWEGNMLTADLTVARSFGISVQQVVSGKGNNPETRPPIHYFINIKICVPLSIMHV